jgi:hypothetical protein
VGIKPLDFDRKISEVLALPVVPAIWIGVDGHVGLYTDTPLPDFLKEILAPKATIPLMEEGLSI